MCSEGESRGKREGRMWKDEQSEPFEHHRGCPWEGSAVGLFKSGCRREIQRKQLKEALKSRPGVGGGSCFVISTSKPSLRRDKHSPL